MAEFALPLTVLGLVAVCLVLLVGVFVLRRYVLASRLGTFDCSLRRGVGSTSGAWVVGVGRYESDRLDWFRIFTMSPRPARSLARSRLVVLDKRRPEPPDTYSLMPGAVIVRCAYGATTLDLAMNERDYDGFATWLESAPPGQGVNLA